MKKKLLFLAISCIALISCSDDNEISNYFEYNEDGKIFVRGGNIINANTNVDMSTILSTLGNNAWEEYDAFPYTSDYVAPEREAGIIDGGLRDYKAFCFSDGEVRVAPLLEYNQSYFTQWIPSGVCDDFKSELLFYNSMKCEVNVAERTITMRYKYTENDYGVITWKIVSLDTDRLVIDREEEIANGNTAFGETEKQIHLVPADKKYRSRCILKPVNRNAYSHLLEISKCKEYYLEHLSTFHPQEVSKWENNDWWLHFGCSR